MHINVLCQSFYKPIKQQKIAFIS